MISKKLHETEFIMEESEENFSTFLDRPNISPDRKEVLRKANVLIVPRDGFRGRPEPVFPVGTSELYQYITEHSGNEISIDICIEETQYKELALHGALIVLGGFVLTAIIAPVMATLIADYIKERFSSKDKSAEIKVEFTVIKENGDASKLLYEGPASTFKDTIKPSLLSLAEGSSNEKDKS